MWEGPIKTVDNTCKYVCCFFLTIKCKKSKVVLVSDCMRCNHRRSQGGGPGGPGPPPNQNSTNDKKL